MRVLATALTGMEAATRQLERAAVRLSRAGITDPDQPDTLDLSEEMVQLLSARTAFEANAKVARLADEADRSVLDLLA